MDNKYQAAESLQDILIIILGYEDRKQSARDGISVDLFLGNNGITYIKNAVKKALVEVQVEQTAELWEMIAVLLRYIKDISCENAEKAPKKRRIVR